MTSDSSGQTGWDTVHVQQDKTWTYGRWYPTYLVMESLLATYCRIQGKSVLQ